MFDWRNRKIIKHIAIFALVLSPTTIYSTKLVTANTDASISRFLVNDEKLLLELYSENSTEIGETLRLIKVISANEGQDNSISCKSIESRISQHRLVDLNKEMLDIVLKIAPQAERLKSIDNQLTIASSIKESYEYLNSIDCTSRQYVLIADDFLIQVKILLLEESNLVKEERK